MRVRVIKDFATANRAFHAGEVANIDPRKAEGWLRAGLVMQDKSLDGARETKEAEHGDEPEPQHGDEPEPQHGDEPEPQHGDEPEPQHGDEPEPQHGDATEEPEVKPKRKSKKRTK